MDQNLKILLRNLEKTREKFWNITPEVGAFLNSIIRERGYKSVIEIGTSNGYSGIWLAEALSYNNGKLYTIESHKKLRYKLAQENFKKSGLEKHIVSILGHAPEDIPSKPTTFDMAFFDATKKEHISYFEVLEKRIAKGGLIITDNILSHQKDFEEYVSLVKSKVEWSSQVLEIGTGLLLSFKK